MSVTEISVDKKSIYENDFHDNAQDIQDKDKNEPEADICTDLTLKLQKLETENNEKNNENNENKKENLPEATDILEQVMLKDLDSGKAVPLSRATSCINPLNLHLLKLTEDWKKDEQDEKADDPQELESIADSAARSWFRKFN